MKKTSLYIFPILAAALFASCSEGLDNVGGQPSEGDFVIDLSVQCVKGVSTRVDAEQWPGLDKYNENTVAYVDWYIFKSSEDTEDALLSGRENIIQEEDETTGLATTDLKVVELDMGDVVSDSQRSFYVYTIANMPDVTHDEMGTTLAELKDLALKSEFNVNPFSAQESFVMTAGQGFTFTDTDKGKLKVITNKLSRLSSKVTINMNVIPAIDQLKTLSNGNRDYVRTWYPVLENVEVYLSFANQETKISAEPVSYNQDGFFTYNRAAFTPAYSYPGLEGDPVETIPSAVTPDWNDNSWKWNVTGTPFYSYPMTWTTDSPQAPFIKVILPWVAYEETATYETTEEGGRTFKSATRNKSGSFLSQEFYYKIPLPGTELKANDWFDLSFDVEILGSTSDELPIDLAGRYCVVDWSDPNIQAGGELKQGRYLSTASDTLYIYGADDIEIPVISSHALATGSTVVTKREVLLNNVWVNATSPTATGSSIAQVRGLRDRALSVIAPGDGRSIIKFTNALNAEMNASLDCYPMRFTLHLSHNEGQGPTKDIVIVQYPPIYISQKPGGNVFIDGYYGNVNNYYQSYSANGESRTFNPTIRNNTLTYEENDGPTIEFGNSRTESAGGNSYRILVGSGSTSGTITVTAPTDRTITEVNITYRNNYAAQTYSWNPASTGTQSATRWRGSASEVSVQLRRNNNNSTTTVTGISVNYTTSPGPGDSGPSGTSGTATTPYAPVARYVDSQTDMTVITISSFSNNPTYEISGATGSPFTYMIADPRVPSGYSSNDLVPYYNGTSTVEWGDSASDVLIGSTTDPTFIAPKFMISSRWGRMGNWQPGSMSDADRLETVQKRCATYQEAGYPAGRWRLPTEAEISFIAGLQRWNFIDDLFTATGYSISASGSVFTVTNGSIGYNQRQGTSCRCVYDLWYWGEDPEVPVGQYTVKVD